MHTYVQYCICTVGRPNSQVEYFGTENRTDWAAHLVSLPNALFYARNACVMMSAWDRRKQKLGRWARSYGATQVAEAFCEKTKRCRMTATDPWDVCGHQGGDDREAAGAAVGVDDLQK